MGENDKKEEPENGQSTEDSSDADKSDSSDKKTSSRLWTPYSESDTEREKPDGKSAAEEEVSEDELRKRIEEALETITVADIVVDMMISLASFGYQRMGIPHDVNEKFRDLKQAKLAIDCIDALINALAGSIPEDSLKSLTGTLDNLKLNYAKES